MLTVPEHAVTGGTLAIAVLQAAARLLSLCPPAPGPLLLHGGAVTVQPGGPAVAVLDGGLGQGKTSLALGLVRKGGSLLADEFLFAEPAGRTLLAHPAPRLPWHVRSDMRPLLVPTTCTGGLIYPDDGHLRPARTRRALHAVLVPDTTRPPGTACMAAREIARHALRHAVTDHRAKLLDPGLDHVSVFYSPEQITSMEGEPLVGRHTVLHRHGRHVLEALVQLPTFFIGIAGPGDLPASVAAAHRALENL